MCSAPTSIQGFKCVETSFDDRCKAGHTLFIKDHSVRNSHPSKPVGKTLFILNVPLYYTEESIKRIFSAAGAVKTVTFQEKPSGTKEIPDVCSFFDRTLPLVFKVAYVVYKDPNSLKKALNKDWGVQIFSTAANPIKTGIEKWVEEYKSKVIDTKALQEEIDNYMKAFDKKQQEEEEKMRLQEGEPDEEGWVTVTKHSKNAARTETMEQKVLEKDKKKQKDKNLINFYSFQMRESKMEHLAQLRKKFEEDKKRIAAMKAARKFKPY